MTDKDENSTYVFELLYANKLLDICTKTAQLGRYYSREAQAKAIFSAAFELMELISKEKKRQ